MLAEQHSLVNDIVFEKYDWRVMGSTPFAELDKARENIFTRATGCSVVVQYYKRLRMSVFYYLLKLFDCSNIEERRWKAMCKIAI